MKKNIITGTVITVSVTTTAPVWPILSVNMQSPENGGNRRINSGERKALVKHLKKRRDTFS